LLAYIVVVGINVVTARSIKPSGQLHKELTSEGGENEGAEREVVRNRKDQHEHEEWADDRIQVTGDQNSKNGVNLGGCSCYWIGWPVHVQ